MRSASREDVAVAFDACDAAGLFEIAECGLKFLLPLWGEVELPEEFRDVAGEIIALGEQG